MKQPQSRLPKFGDWLLRLLARYDVNPHLRGDFDEEFSLINETKGFVRAWFWYWTHLLRSLPVFIKDILYWRSIMFKNYLKIALRNMKRHKGYSFINIAGLAIGIACSMLMFMWVQDELSYDRFHGNANELHRILLDPLEAATTHEAVSPPVLARKMREELPEVVNTTRMTSTSSGFFTYGDKTSFEDGGLLADSSLFDMFSFPLVRGDTATVFNKVRSLVISEALAAKYFRDEDPIGKVLTLDNRTDYTVTGVMKNVPINSHLQFDYVRPFKLLGEVGRDLESWGDVSYYTYVQLQKGSSYKEVNKKLKAMIEREDPSHNLYYLQPLTRIHLYSNFNFDFVITGNILYVYIFAAAALFVLLIACINFMNLATARSGIRAKEVGMRKVVGANKFDIIKQFYGESILSVLIAIVFAVGLILLLLPAFNNLSGKDLTFSLLGNTEMILGLLIITVFTGILSGSYPALFLSAFHPIKVIRGTLQTGVRGLMFRKILVVTQFSLTIMLTISTLVVSNQLTHIRERNLGYTKANLVAIPLRGEVRENFEAFKTQLLKETNILNVTGSSSLPTHIGSGTSGAEWEGKTPGVRIQMQISSVDFDYLETFKMEMAQGRFFSKEHPADNRAFVLNEAAIKAMDIKSPLGKSLNVFGTPGPIIGVIKDFNYKSLHTEIEPLILLVDPQNYFYACVRINAGNVSATIESMEAVWKKFVSGFPFDYSFLDDRIDNLYRAEQRMGKVFNSFTVLAVFIACLGLFGMVSFTAERRTKEIGIRKLLGASVPSVVSLLSKDFTKLVLISNIIAWPAAYFVMNLWLQSFAYRTKIGIGIFLTSGMIALIIVVLTVSYQSIKAATANPVDSLRYE